MLRRNILKLIESIIKGLIMTIGALISIVSVYAFGLGSVLCFIGVYTEMLILSILLDILIKRLPYNFYAMLLPAAIWILYFLYLFSVYSFAPSYFKLSFSILGLIGLSAGFIILINDYCEAIKEKNTDII